MMVTRRRSAAADIRRDRLNVADPTKAIIGFYALKVAVGRKAGTRCPRRGRDRRAQIAIIPRQVR
jgi:hypothetical protein